MFLYSKTQFEIEMLDDRCPKGNWGSRLRGIYGHYLRNRFCIKPDRPPCGNCDHLSLCHYPLLFEISNSPSPYLFELPAEDGPNTENYETRTRLKFNFIAFGRASRDIGQAVNAFRNAAAINSRGEKGCFRLTAAKDILAGDTIVDIEPEVVPITSRNIWDDASSQIWTTDRNRLQVDFVTNTRIENRHSRMKDSRTGLTIFSDFFDLTYNLLLRFKGLWQLYGESSWQGEEEFKKGLNYYLKASREIDLVESSLEIHRPNEIPLKRLSSRHEDKLPLDGFTGTMVFVGDTSPFAHLLRIGEITHLGNCTSVGLGQYRLKP